MGSSKDAAGKQRNGADMGNVSQFSDQVNVLLVETLEEVCKFYHWKNEERRRERFEDTMNESLRRRGYPPLHPGSRKRRRQGW